MDKRIIIFIFLCILMPILGCSNNTGLSNSFPDNLQTDIFATTTNQETATSKVGPIAETQEIFQTDTPEINLVEEKAPDLSQLEGTKIYYVTDTGISKIMFECRSDNADCIEYQELISFDQMKTFNEIVCVSLSPGEDQLTFGSRDYSPAGSTDLYRYDFETGRTYRLTETPDYSECGAWWSPDGQILAVRAHRFAGGHSYIYTISPSGCCQQTIPNQGKFDRNPSWSPDGENIAFISGTGFESYLFVYYIKNREVVALAPEMTFKSSTRMSWSPDGTKLAVLAFFEDDTDICIVEIASNEYFCLNEIEYTERLPSWSPDGSRLIYSAFHRHYETNSIYQINTDGTNKTQITADGKYIDPIWIGDGGFFVCNESFDANHQLWLFTTDGSWQQQLTFENAGAWIISISQP